MFLGRIFEKKDPVEAYYFQEGRKFQEYDAIVSAYIRYYHQRSRKNKRWYRFWSVMKLLIVAAIPIVQDIGWITSFPWLLASCTSGIFLIESVQEIWRFKEKWILYQDTCNRLMSIQRQYMASQTGILTYNQTGYVQAVEALIGDEAREWVELIKKQHSGQEEEEKTPDGTRESGQK